jgi:hypothetical protein
MKIQCLQRRHRLSGVHARSGRNRIAGREGFLDGFVQLRIADMALISTLVLLAITSRGGAGLATGMQIGARLAAIALTATFNAMFRTGAAGSPRAGALRRGRIVSHISTPLLMPVSDSDNRPARLFKDFLPKPMSGRGHQATATQH